MMRDVSPAASSRATPAGRRFPRPSCTSRLVGLDLARGVAILGMYAVHLGPDPAVGGPLGWAMEAAAGRAATLFALLAGFTLVILTGRPEPQTGRAGRQAVGRVLIRSAVLFAMGYALTWLDTPIEVILSFYGLLFVLALPLYRLRAAALAVIAAATALVMPVVVYLLRAAVDGGSWSDAFIAHDPLALVTGSDGVLELFVTGEYPVLTWLPFIVTGMALAKLDLTRPRVASTVALTGVALAVLGYGGSWLALHLVPGAPAAVSAATEGGPAASAWWSDAIGNEPTAGEPAWLLVAAPHSQTTWSILGNTGAALVVVAVCFVLMDRSPRLRWLAAPVTALGTIALTAYVGHILGVKALNTFAMPDSTALPVFLGFAAVAMLAAVAWTWFFRRGPLEYCLHLATTPTRLIT
ncbi:heparan-alpha-glucosaminide N-acetyltransferase domain-containing protein [Streptomyces sp. NPDC017936]|uniref:heparan-alpha-glucosaminide N-acetyltransferase domain-containing protein n=1 Tax=Streptomyces sp. NPDC017936 TaxID=3365016 RepID=UPI00379F2B2D